MGKGKLAITTALGLVLLYGKSQEDNYNAKGVETSQSATEEKIRKVVVKTPQVHGDSQNEDVIPEEFSIDEIPTNTEGGVATNYNAVTAITDCVDSTGIYICLNKSVSDAICWGNNTNGDNAPINISITSGFTAETLKAGDTAPRITVGQGGSSNHEDFNLKGEVDELSEQHTQACQTAITMLNERAPVSQDTDWSQERSAWDEMTKKINALWEGLEAQEYMIKDSGGGQIEVQIGDHSVDISATLKSDFQSAFFVKGPNQNDFHTFNQTEEVIAYLSTLE